MHCTSHVPLVELFIILKNIHVDVKWLHVTVVLNNCEDSGERFTGPKLTLL